MKPLTNIKEFLDRFDSFCDGELRHVDVISPTTISITLTTQDKAKDFDWVSITLEFSGVSDALLLENKKLNLVDMSNGISIIKENNLFYFGIGRCKNISNIKTSTCHTESLSIKYKQGTF